MVVSSLYLQASTEVLSGSFLLKIGKKAAELSNFVQVRQNLAFYWRFCEITAIKFFTFAPPIKVSAAKKLTSVTFRSPRKHLKHFWSYKLINLLPIRFVGLASTREMIRAFQLIFRPKKKESQRWALTENGYRLVFPAFTNVKPLLV